MGCIRVIICATLLASSPGHGQRIAPTHELSAVRVELTWVANSAELAAIRKRYDGVPHDLRAVRQNKTETTGFSVLTKRGDEYICRLFVPKPENVDDDRTTALGHELLHCLLGAYH